MLYLKEIATIRSGYLFRGKIEPDAGGQYQVIQVGDITSNPGSNSRFADGALTRVSLPDVKQSQILEKGDVLFISRGPRKQAVAIADSIVKAIATSQFFVIRANETVLPEYLAWYINQSPAQRYINEHSSGSSITLINIEALKMLPIETPPMEIQHRIVQIHKLSLRERELIEAIQNKRRTMIESALLRTVAVRGARAQ
jgi:restriction endonuclease S subunit